MKLPAYYTQFLACCEGEHKDCQHIDSEGNVIWVCGCACHPAVLLNHADLGTEFVVQGPRSDYPIAVASA